MIAEVVAIDWRRFDSKGAEKSDDDETYRPIRIRTLGHFEVSRHGELLGVDGRGKKRPLQLLKALIALGGEQVHQEKLAELLWPDAEGDAAQKVFDTTLYRLRRLLGLPEVLLLREGRLSLNRRYCWLDCWHFESLQHRIDRECDGGMSPARMRYFSKALFSLYHRHFLQLDADEVWVLGYRQSMQSKFVRVINKLGLCWEQHHQFEQALDLYLRVLEQDWYLESFYQRAMKCYEIMGLRAEALMLYQRCRMQLQRQLQIEPSRQTEALRESIMQG